MRNSVISSSVSTVVAQVNDSLVAAGVAVRTLLRHTCMREQRSGWHRPRVVFESEPFGLGSIIAARIPGAGLKRSRQCALAYCPAHAANARFAPRG